MLRRGLLGLAIFAIGSALLQADDIILKGKEKEKPLKGNVTTETPKEIKLAGGTSGCGILLVEGDLNLDGGFSWYGPVIVTGSVTYAGGGNKHLTGAILAGGSVNGDLLGGNANLVYCSTAISDQTQNLPLQILSWKEL